MADVKTEEIEALGEMADVRFGFGPAQPTWCEPTGSARPKGGLRRWLRRYRRPGITRRRTLVQSAAQVGAGGKTSVRGYRDPMCNGPPPAWHETATPARPPVAAWPLIRKSFQVGELRNKAGKTGSCP